jgi:hypothetical protein
MSDTPETYETYETHETHETHETIAGSETRGAAPQAPVVPPPAEPFDVAPPLAALIAAIRLAVVQGASPEARAAGATACRSILTVLEAKPGQPLWAPPPAATSPTSPIASLLSQPGLLSKLAGMSREQLLDLLKQVTGAMPARPHTPATVAPRFHLIQIPQVRRPGGT